MQGKTALVTGASRGIGKAIAMRLASEGAAVALNYRERRAEAESVAEEIRRAGGRALLTQADVSERTQVESMIAAVRADLGPVDILVNNAGVLRRGDLEDFDFSQMDNMRRTNVDGLVHVTRAVAGDMKQRRYGRIVNLTSIAAHGTSMTGTTFYAATKSAVTTLTRRFALDLGPHGITVNAIAPGFIMTEMVTDGKTPEQTQELIQTMSGKAMMRRVGQPDDVAGAVAFLVSEQAGFITAQILTVDGGRMDYLTHP